MQDSIYMKITSGRLSNNRFFDLENVKKISPLLVLLIINLIVGLLKINKYAPLTEGWWTTYSRWIKEGRIPYLDFNLIVPPGMPYLNLFFSSIFSENFLTLRYLGLLLQLIISIYVFFLFRYVTSAYRALLISVLVVQIFYSTEVVIYFDYNYFAIFFLIAGVFHFQKALQTDVVSQKAKQFLFSGIFLGLSTSVKFNFVFFFLIFFSLGEIFSRRRKIYGKTQKRQFFAICSGFFLSWIPWIIYSIAVGAFKPFLYSMFLDAPSSKGSFLISLTGWIIRLPEQFNLSKNIIAYLLCFFALLGLDRVWLRETRFRRELNFLAPLPRFRFIIWSAFILLCFYSSLRFVVYGDYNEISEIIHSVGNLLLIISRVMPVWFVIYMWLMEIFRGNDDIYLPLCLLSMSLIFATGSSGGLNWYGTALPFGVMTAFFWNKVIHQNIFMVFAGVLTPLICGALLMNWASSPYNWWGLRTVESYKANRVISQGLMAGLRTDDVSLATIRIVQRELNKANGCSNGLFSFPSIPFFLLEAGVQPKGRDAIFWFDFVSQKNVGEAILELKKSPPDAAVILSVPDFVWTAHSEGFNKGRKYKQRELVKIILDLEKSGYSKRELPLFASPGYSIITLVNESCKRK